MALSRGSVGKMRRSGFVIACEARPEIRFVRAIDQNKPLFVSWHREGGAAAAAAVAAVAVALSEAIR